MEGDSSCSDSEEAYSVDNFMHSISSLTEEDKARITTILNSDVMKKNEAKISQYITTVEALPLKNENLRPIAANKIFVMEHLNDHFDNIAIKMMNMIVGMDCNIVDCDESANIGAYFGYRNDFYTEKPLIGSVIEGVAACHSLSGMIVFNNAQCMLKKTGIVNLVNRNNRRKFVDNYLNFPLDLSKFTFLFFVDSFDSIPANLMEHFHKMEYTWVETVQVNQRSVPKGSSVRDNESVNLSDVS
ncbi:hypothetical protein FO519_000871 [Halicephalobus sp. NKZ332]|nr:hypothetical protein FO519_000871 [Halicephalobus sp. NKZ332]